MMSTLPVLVSAACALRGAAQGVQELEHISLSVSSFLDASTRLSLQKAAASGSMRLFHRVLHRLQHSVPPINEFLMESYLGKAMEAAVKGGHLDFAKEIHELHPGKLDVKLLPLAAANGDIQMLQWVMEHRRDERCVPCPHEREEAIEVLEDPPSCCVHAMYARAVDENQFEVIRWLVDKGYDLPGHLLAFLGDNAACSGDLEMVKWLHHLNAKHSFTTKAIDEAVRGGHTEVVAFLLANRSEGWTEKAEHYAAVGGHHEIEELLASPTYHHLQSSQPRDWLYWAATAGRFDDVEFRELLAAERGHSAMTMTMKYGCEHGRLDIVQWVVGMDAALVSSNTLILAVTKGHLHILQWVHDQDIGGGSCFDASLVRAAAHAGHLDIIQWFDQHYSGVFTTEAMNVAAVNGHLEIVKWLHVNRTEGCTTSAMDGASNGGHLHVVQWLHENRTEGCTREAMNRAARRGDLDVVKFLHEHRSEGCSTWAMDDAAASGHLEMVIWLHENRTEGCTTQAMDKAPVHVVKWLHYNRTEGCTTDAMDSAARRGDLAKLEFLHAHRTEGCTFVAAMNAADGRHVYIVGWLGHHIWRL